MLPKARLILADPPWKFASRRATRKDNPGKKNKFGIGVERRYSAGTMQNNDICDLGPLIQQISTDDAYLCMWACRSLLPEALAVIDAWGFKYITELKTWVKSTVNGKIFQGPGAYSLSNTEPLLLARRCNSRGATKPLWHNNKKGCVKIQQVLITPHPRDENNKIIHSRKPEEVHKDLERWLFPYLGEYGALELFATQEREGWTCLGHALSGKLLHEEIEEKYV